ncbi:hypothetical protein CHLNCDRAFT_132898 [Chlorella variabilis]|uniref:YqaJ viral recombinase domain-containing protein n=1 Tax=Chlorella variabilis TaxID=554065 RepID=E1Z1W7_CHLVA|nr:hypothetical protein CHLNCDRAFT_132898 [Chlorella variabilis]EFN59566.1 hypothetical protein CHLNCDRAFT_132898 [Chlorella variabilis]|eukprot:XP_005851668.1 hypothetical protein CHLNCDRAFT_132898 [Chlorella variabilis]
MRRACSSDVMLLEPAAGRRPLGTARRLGAAAGAPPIAAAAAGPQQPQQAQQQAQPSQPRHHQAHQQQQREQYEHIQRQWYVPRSKLHHYPEDTQQAIRGGRRPQARSLASSTAAASQPSPPAGGSRGAQAALAAELEKLGAALEYERRAGFVNVVGSVEKVPVGEWAARQLLSAAGQLQDPEAAHECVAAAQQLRRYASAPPAQRPAAVAAAEAAARRALLSVQVGGRQPTARQARHQPPGAGQQQQQQQQQQQPRERPQPQPQPQQQQQQLQPARIAVPAQARQPAPEAAAGRGSAAAQPKAAPLASAAGAGPAQARHVAPPAAPSLLPAAAQQALPAAAAAAEHEHEHELDAAAAEAHAEEVGQAVPTPEGEEYVMQGNRRIKASTAAFRRSFAEAAAAADGAPAGGGVAAAAAAGGEQRSAEWFRMRQGRLTASAFSKALGLFEGDRQQLWAEKVGMVEPFAGNAATAWGTSAEPRALDAYQAATCQAVTSCMFQVKRDDAVHGWLGASPDGLIESLAVEPQAGASPPPGPAGQPGAAARAATAVARGGGPLAGPGRGILEIKCPHNRGQPELAVPPQHATWYYMPQVQGLMYIFDCEWCNLYIWTPQRGSAVYHIRRDRAYWARLWEVLADFWWNNVVPARQEFQAGRWEEVEQYRPPPTIDATEELRQWSKRLALQAPVTFFRPQP